MKKLIIYLFILSGVNCYAQEKTNSWDYPIKPGTEEWNKLKTESERIKAIQIPMDVLNNMNSKELIFACINFPLFGYYSAFNTPQDGFNIMFSRFNIFSKLCEKDSIGQFLINIYKDADMIGWKNMGDVFNDDYWTLKLNYTEYLISQKEILKNLSNNEKKELIKEAKKKFNQKKNHESFSSLTGESSTLLLISRILNMENGVKNSLLNKNAFQSFIKSGNLNDINIAEEIIQSAEVYLNQ